MYAGAGGMVSRGRVAFLRISNRSLNHAASANSPYRAQTAPHSMANNPKSAKASHSRTLHHVSCRG
jgi:hypothetical protein